MRFLLVLHFDLSMTILLHFDPWMTILPALYVSLNTNNNNNIAFFPKQVGVG